jgi:phosphoribosylanthranilate isomerase
MMIKICGITNRQDALAAVEAGATAIGFNFYPRSTRYISPNAAAVIAAHVDVLKVGVFVDDPDAAVIADQAGMDVVQLHGAETPAQVPSGVRVWKAFRVSSDWDASVMSEYPVEAFLLDGPSPGSGETFDWRRAAGLGNVILAGGLGPDNVSEAIRQVRPWGVDACSRLERAPGVKDYEKMRRFIKAAMEQL